MLHEILLSLAGHPSPLLRADPSGPHANALSPPERELLASLSHLSDLHVRLLGYTAQIASSHPSTICRAVAASISSVHLAAFQRKVLEVEATVLRRDAGLVGAYNIVPLTAVVGEFSDWTRRMEWLWGVVGLMLETEDGKQQPQGGERDKQDEKKLWPLSSSSSCTGARIIDRLRGELQTGYVDIEATAASLVAVAETAWLKQVAAWILYGRLPSFGVDDFFVQKGGQNEEEFLCNPTLLPSFVTPSMASSMLFIGTSLNHIRARGGDPTASSSSSASSSDGPSQGVHHHLASQLAEVSALTFPLDGAVLARTIAKVRLFLSRNILQKFLPLVKVMEMLQLLRDFFLLGRGEFAMALTQQADEKMRGRWRRAENLAAGGLPGSLMVKEGEVVAVLARTWGALGSLQGQHSEEDEGLERARDLMRLTLAGKSSSPPPPSSSKAPATPSKRAVTTANATTASLRLATTTAGAGAALIPIASTPFRNLLFSVPIVLTLRIPSPLDLFLGPADVQAYTSVNSYLLSIRRAHIRLTDLWKITSLRRHHPPPPGPPTGSSRAGRAKVLLLRRRETVRSRAMRSAWATSSAAIFFLAEMEAYLQTEVVAGLWDGFQQWLILGSDGGGGGGGGSGGSSGPKRGERVAEGGGGEPETRVAAVGEEGDDDMWLAAADGSDERRGGDSEEDVDMINTTPPPAAGEPGEDRQRQPHDPQTLAAAHRFYLHTLCRRILLTHQSFTDVLYELLVGVDHLVALVRRLHGIWTSMDLEEDAGVVDAFVDLEREEADVKADMAAVERRVKGGVEACVAELRRLEVGLLGGDGGGGGGGVPSVEGCLRDGDADGVAALAELGEYVPRRVGGVDRLLMKLDFGTWFESRPRGDDQSEIEGD